MLMVPPEMERRKAKRENEAKKQILQSTTIIGGSSVISIMAAVARAKVVAVLLGPSGVGLIGLYHSIMTTAGTVAGMGINTSGVRQISESCASGESRLIASARFSLKWVALFLGFLGTLVLFLLRYPVSQWTFGNHDHVFSIGILSIGVFAMVTSGSLRALLQGFRRISDIARVNILGSVIGSLVAVLMVYVFREEGVAFLVVSVVLATWVFSWWYSHKIPRTVLCVSLNEVARQTKPLVGLGLAVMSMGFMAVGTLLLVRVLVTKRLGIEATGYFQASWNISMLYVGIALGAMGADFYPRLTALNKDHVASNKLVNEQTEMALLIVGPMLLGMLTFTPLVTYLLYSESFAPTNSILRWQLLGTLFKVFAFPIAYVILAKGFGKTLFLMDFIFNSLFLSIVWIGMNHVGLDITGIAILVGYFVFFSLVYLIVSRINKFSWTLHNKTLALSLCIASIIVFLSSAYYNLFGYILGSIFTVGFAVYSVKSLRDVIGISGIGQIAPQLKRMFHLN